MGRVRRLLVANRGEIARRVFRTCRAMGIETVAVYAAPDAGLPFVGEAGLAVPLRGESAAETYLDIEQLIAAARAAGADAVHPGYGFLSENAAFPQAVLDAGLTWVGPNPAAIAAMGDKLAAKARLQAAGVPMLPSIEVRGEPGDELLAQAEGIRYPVLVKASGGGGGRGMRVVPGPLKLLGAVESARREALGAFGNETVFLERYLERARHIEVQVFGDRHGNVVHLFERECSIQRRHQKVVEEAPSPAVDAELRRRLGEAAVQAAYAIGYDNAGTVEFLVDEHGQFYFLEMNTRLQVEHPVTEAITGIDLVREQIRVAEGHALSFAQEDLRIDGHAIEVRLYAEDPAQDFLPSPGPVLWFEPPADVPHRMESAVESGSVVPVQFDPMIAKVITHAATREEAALRLALVLKQLRVHGLTTNRDFLANVLRHDAFLAGDTTTDFIERVRPARTHEGRDAQLAAYVAVAHEELGRVAAAGSWPAIAPGWRNNPHAAAPVEFECGGATYRVAHHRPAPRKFVFEDNEPGETSTLTVVEYDAEGLVVEAAWRGATLTGRFDVLRAGGRAWVQRRGGDEYALGELPRFPKAQAQAQAGGYAAPMPGKVVAVHVQPGDRVHDGQLLVVLEAMKMEHHVTASGGGVVARVNVAPGQQVEGGATLVVIDAGEGGQG
ncbi:MAG: biotin/lipoyl-binding protein [Dehalococcoidia bacterium]|nr:biotin/lipoyl-binding protein [Dehalococcoidia bacterium]